MRTHQPGDPPEQAEQAVPPGTNGKLPPPGTGPTAIGDTGRLPIDPRTGDPIPPKAQPGYYPGYSTLNNKKFWDEATRKVIEERIEKEPPIEFFTKEEALLMEAISARILPQDDRDEQHRIPIVPQIDKKLKAGKGPGYQYRDLPPDTEVFKLGLQAVEAIALHVYNRPFQDLSPYEQDYVLETIHDEHPPAGHEFWDQMSIGNFWQVLVTNVIEVYYAHPWSWDEIGFGGPAYPRGYMRLHGGEPEPWEVEEQRYEWEPPPTSLSGEEKFMGLEDPLESQLSGNPHRAPAQGGTH